MREEQVEAAGGRLRVLVGGTGPELLMLHGFASGIEGWPAEALRRLSQSRTILAVDLPGHGGSDPAPPGSLSSEAVVETVSGVVERVFGGGPVDWYGYSMGARIALSALRLGVPIRGLALESANPGIEDADARRARAERDSRWASRFEREAPHEVLDDWLSQPIFASRDALEPTEKARQRRVREAADAASLGLWLREFGSGAMPPTWSAVAASGLPLRLLVGEHDSRYLALAERIRVRRPDASLQVVPGVGHAPHMEAPARWLDWMSADRGDG